MSFAKKNYANKTDRYGYGCLVATSKCRRSPPTASKTAHAADGRRTSRERAKKPWLRYRNGHGDCLSKTVLLGLVFLREPIHVL
jgi:hypothetical protein